MALAMHSLNFVENSLGMLLYVWVCIKSRWTSICVFNSVPFLEIAKLVFAKKKYWQFFVSLKMGQTLQYTLRFSQLQNIWKQSRQIKGIHDKNRFITFCSWLAWKSAAKSNKKLVNQKYNFLSWMPFSISWVMEFLYMQGF